MPSVAIKVDLSWEVKSSLDVLTFSHLSPSHYPPFCGYKEALFQIHFMSIMTISSSFYICAFLFNVVITIMSWKCKGKEMGIFKYLLFMENLLTAVSCFLFSGLDIVSNTYPQGVSEALVFLYYAIYLFSLVILSFSFLYRYCVLYKPKLLDKIKRSTLFIAITAAFTPILCFLLVTWYFDAVGTKNREYVMADYLALISGTGKLPINRYFVQFVTFSYAYTLFLFLPTFLFSTTKVLLYFRKMRFSVLPKKTQLKHKRFLALLLIQMLPRILLVSFIAVLVYIENPVMGGILQVFSALLPYIHMAEPIVEFTMVSELRRTLKESKRQRNVNPSSHLFTVTSNSHETFAEARL